MARAVTLQSTQPLARAQTRGRAISGAIEGTAQGFVSGVQMGQQQQKFEIEKAEYAKKVAAAEKSKKAFASLKQQTEKELAGILKGKSFDYVDSRFKAVRQAENVDDLRNIAANIQAEIQVDQDYVKKYPNLSFGQANRVSGTVLANPKYGESITTNAQERVDKDLAKNIEIKAREFAADPTNKNLDMEDAWIKFHSQEKLPEGALKDKSIKPFFEMGWTSEGERLRAELARTREGRLTQQAQTKMDDITNVAFKALEKKEAALTNKILQETKVDVRNLSDPAQFLASEEFKSLDTKRQEEMRNVIDKREELQKKVKLASAAAKIGMQGLTEAKIDVIYKDAVDADGPTAPETKKLWEAAGFTGIASTPPPPEKPKLDPERREKLKKFLKK